MSNPIVECIANYSEARRPDVIDAISQSILDVPGVRLLDRHSDLDHNRTVLTFVGAPEAVLQAAFNSIARAAELINLEEHRGEHPRIGATDVVPFVPISGVSMQECVALARRLGERVGNELGIPVYLYEEAATRPERQNLENIRRGQYEGLKEEIHARPERTPDYGPSRLGTAGATVIGARQPLIAFNVYLTIDDVSVAKKVAKAVRYSTGGLRYVKGLGMLVDGRAQVSMNLTNFHATPLAQVVEMIRREAARYGAGIHHSELVGLIPQEALVDAAQWYLQLDQFEPEQILEKRLAASQEAALTAAPGVAASADLVFLDALAEATPAPGGGSAAAYSGAAGAALVAMVARLTLGKKKYAAVETQMSAALEFAERLRMELTAAIEQDAAAFEQVMAAYRLPKDSPEAQAAREQAIETAMLTAARVPLQVAGKAVEVLALATQVVELGNLNAISDGATGGALARAALSGAGYNVRINAASLKDSQSAQEMLAQLLSLEQQAAVHEGRLRSSLVQRGGFSLE
jgi:glutamate formiminotransferase/formiminotetrahydrofolate cyclodeaminase